MESLSMKFQASRFSASGRRVPLEPRNARRTAYASPCMFSRLERDVVCVFCWVVPGPRPAAHVWGAIRVQWPRLLLKTCLVIICFTLRLRGSRRLQLLEWRFDGCVSSYKCCVGPPSCRRPCETYLPQRAECEMIVKIKK